MKRLSTFERRGVVEGFFGAPWSMARRQALFGAARRWDDMLRKRSPNDSSSQRENSADC
jgi:hypothetical protein